MNTIFGYAVGHWKRVKLQHVSFLCGLTVAVSAAVALGGLQTSSTAQRETPTLSPAERAVASMILSTKTYYIVDSLEQRERVLYTIGLVDPPPPSAVLVAGTTLERDLYDAAAATWREYALNLQVVDLRNR